MAQQVTFGAAFFAFLLGPLPSWSALSTGAVLGLLGVNPWPGHARRVSSLLLKGCVVLLGARLALNQLVDIGLQSLPVTITGIAATLLLAQLMRRVFGSDAQTALLIGCGTAICGGSAIAAVASVLRPEHRKVAIALGVVFLLNGVALVIFPPLGGWLGLSQEQFGLWAALAIHDTSSVVGAASAYGEPALLLATLVKLVRALWIVPTVLVIAVVANRGERGPGWKVVPAFVVLFVLVSVLFTWLGPVGRPIADHLSLVGRHGLVACLFLIGSSLDRPMLRQSGGSSLGLGLTLWGVVSVASLGLIRAGLVKA